MHGGLSSVAPLRRELMGGSPMEKPNLIPYEGPGYGLKPSGTLLELELNGAGGLLKIGCAPFWVFRKVAFLYLAP